MRAAYDVATDPRRPVYGAKERLYHLVAVNDRTGYRERLTAWPMNHAHCRIMRSKSSPHKDVRIVFVEVKS